MLIFKHLKIKIKKEPVIGQISTKNLSLQPGWASRKSQRTTNVSDTDNMPILSIITLLTGQLRLKQIIN